MKPKILIVDDKIENLIALERILGSLDITMVRALSGNEALSQTLKNDFALVITDVQMPEMDGFEMVELLRSDRKTKYIPVIFVSAIYSDNYHKVKGIETGGVDFISKPIVPEILKGKVKIFIELYTQKKLLEEQNAKLEKLNDLKSNYVADVSHEFKNPLTVISESMGLILDGTVGTGLGDDQISLLNLGKKSVERLIRLINDILDLSKIESGGMSIKREQVDIVEVLKDLIGTYKYQIVRKKLNIKTSIDPDFGIIWGDRDKLVQVFTNLMSNSIKYTPEKSSITFILKGDKQKVRVEIRDTGNGIPEDEVPTLFDRYSRVKAEKQEGTGLGLAIVKEIIDMHKGLIWVESVLGKGTKFIFEIPRDLRITSLNGTTNTKIETA